MFRSRPSVRAARTLRSAAPLAVLLLVLPLAGACGGGGDDGTAAAGGEAQRIENPELGIAVVIPPGSPFELVSNQDDEIRLRFPANGEFSEGTAIYTAGPEQDYGINLVDAVNARKAELEAKPDGEFFGQVELGSENLGTAYSTRGRYSDENGRTIEELRIFAVHPGANRLLTMTYRYEPAPGQTQARLVDQAAEALGYVEALAPAAGEEAAGGAAGEGDPTSGEEAGAGAADAGQ